MTQKPKSSKKRVVSPVVSVPLWFQKLFSITFAVNVLFQIGIIFFYGFNLSLLHENFDSLLMALVSIALPFTILFFGVFYILDKQKARWSRIFVAMLFAALGLELYRFVDYLFGIVFNFGARFAGQMSWSIYGSWAVTGLPALITCAAVVLVAYRHRKKINAFLQ